jgi:hypothetical protein
MQLKYPVLGQTHDVEGYLWDVRDVRTTRHGFDLLFGSPAPRGRDGCGLPRLIATKSLIDFWEVNRLRPGTLFDLPAGRTTLKRVRYRFGFNHVEDRSAYWRARIHDLATMKPRDFALRHGVTPETAFEWRAKLVGRRARKLGWWRESEPLAILQSTLTPNEMCRKLGISRSHVQRLTARARSLMSAPTPQEETPCLR